MQGREVLSTPTVPSTLMGTGGDLALQGRKVLLTPLGHVHRYIPVQSAEEHAPYVTRSHKFPSEQI